jgi:hypothetical protein
MLLRRWSGARLRAELGALEASVERAGAALACAYSSSDEFEASEIRARRAAGLLAPRFAGQMRLVLWATAITSIIALAAHLL